MVEPTESESKAELDRFIDAMIAIRGEIRAIEEGRSDRADNPLKHAPHTASAVSRRRLDARAIRARTAAYPAGAAPVAKVLAAGRARRQRVRRPQPRSAAAFLLADVTRTAIVRPTLQPDARRSSWAAAWSASPPRGTSPRDGHDVTVVDRQAGRGAGDVVRQRRPDLRVVRRAVGEPGRAAEDPASGWAATTRRCCSVCAPIWRQWRWGSAVPARMPAVAHAPQHDPVPQSRALFARLPAGAARADRASTTTISSAASCQFYTDPTEFAQRRRGGGH